MVASGLGQPAKPNKIQVTDETRTIQFEGGGYIVESYGYFPANAPRYSIIISTHKERLPMSGGLIAGGVLKQIIEYIITYSEHFNLR